VVPAERQRLYQDAEEIIVRDAVWVCLFYFKTAIVRQPHVRGIALSEFGEVTGCLFDEFEFHLVGAYHPDGLTYGPTPGPADAPNLFCYFAEHFGFAFVNPSEVARAGGRGLRGCPPGCYRVRASCVCR
jgi:hypothetical protein